MRKTRSELRPLVTLRISSIAVAPKASCRPRNTAALFSCGIISLRCYWIGGTTIETDDDADRWCPQGFWAQSCHCSPGKERAKSVSDHMFHVILKLAHIARATSSFPVPLSPSIRTFELVAAALRMYCLNCAITALSPTSCCHAVSISFTVASVYCSGGLDRR